MDAWASNVDLDLDARVHKALLDIDATVLVICHRLQHIWGFDRVLVFEGGKIVEDGPPSELLRSDHSWLKRMCVTAGIDVEQMAGRSDVKAPSEEPPAPAPKAASPQASPHEETAAPHASSNAKSSCNAS